MSAITANIAPGPRPRTVAIVVYDGVAMFEFAVAYQIFGRDYALGSDPPWYRLVICGPGPATFDNGMRADASHGLADLRRADTVIVPPCEAPHGPPEAVLRALRRAHARGARLVSLCTGTFVLAAAV